MPERPSHLDVVTSMKATLIQQGFFLAGPCGAFHITRHVAWALREEGMGLLAKVEGNNCDGYATDILCYPDGAIVDILGDSGGANTPTWQNRGFVDPTLYRSPLPPPDEAPPSHDPPSPPSLETRVHTLTDMVYNLKANVALLEAQMSDLPRQLNGIRTRLHLLESPSEISTNRVWGHAHVVKIP